MKRSSCIYTHFDFLPTLKVCVVASVERGRGLGGRKNGSGLGRGGRGRLPLAPPFVHFSVRKFLIGWTVMRNLLMCISKNSHVAGIKGNVLYWHKLWKINVISKQTAVWDIIMYWKYNIKQYDFGVSLSLKFFITESFWKERWCLFLQGSSLVCFQSFLVSSQCEMEINYCKPWNPVFHKIISADVKSVSRVRKNSLVWHTAMKFSSVLT